MENGKWKMENGKWKMTHAHNTYAKTPPLASFHAGCEHP
jgi:hypothetical protein